MNFFKFLLPLLLLVFHLSNSSLSSSAVLCEYVQLLPRAVSQNITTSFFNSGLHRRFRRVIIRHDETGCASVRACIELCHLAPWTTGSVSLALDLVVPVTASCLVFLVDCILNSKFRSAQALSFGSRIRCRTLARLEICH